MYMIEWHIIEYTMWKFSFPDCLQIWKMIHEWTPTRVSPRNSPTIISDTLCPTCWIHQETRTHIHQCNHPYQNKIYQTLQLKLAQLLPNSTSTPTYNRCIGWEYGTPSATRPTILLTCTLPHFTASFTVKLRLDGNYGRFSKQWTHYLSQHHPKIEPTTFYTKILALTWRFWPLESMEQWPPHCNSLISTKNAFQFQWNLCHTWQVTSSHPGKNLSYIQGKIASNTQIVHWDWILHSTKYIQNKLRTIAKQNQLNMQDIQQFFNPA